MVLFVNKWDVHPDKQEAYTKWAKSSIASIIAAPGLVEFRGYRPAAGSSQIVATFEFADMAGFAAWYDHPNVQTIYAELRDYSTHVSSELWGPSPVVPQPIRPGG